MSFPQRLFLPVAGKSHSVKADIGVGGKKQFNAFLEIVVGMDMVLQIRQTTQQAIEFGWTHTTRVNPSATELIRNGRFLRETPVPYTGMVSKTVAEHHNTAYPTFKTQMLRKIKFAGYLFLHLNIIEVVEQFRQYAK